MFLLQYLHLGDLVWIRRIRRQSVQNGVNDGRIISGIDAHVIARLITQVGISRHLNANRAATVGRGKGGRGWGEEMVEKELKWVTW